MIKNILSFNGKNILGKEIKEWIKFHIENQTEYSKMAKTMERYLETIIDERNYKIDLAPKGTGCGERKRYHPNIILVK